MSFFMSYANTTEVQSKLKNFTLTVRKSNILRITKAYNTVPVGTDGLKDQHAKREDALKPSRTTSRAN